MSKNNLLKQKIKNKLRMKLHHQKYPPTFPTLIGAGFSTDDAFYMGESWFKGVGSAIGIKPKQNPQLQTMKWLESKTHHTHSGFQKTLRFINKFDNVSVLDTPNRIVRKRIMQSIHGRN